MRSAPLTTIQGGLSRLRLKGGARADTLYDFINGYRLDSGRTKARPGTRRVARLDAATRGLVSFDGSLHTFCHKAVYVPDGFTLDILVHPDTTETVDVAAVPDSGQTFTMTAGNGSSGRYIGFDDNTTLLGLGVLGSMTPVALDAGPTITTLYAYSPTNNENSQTQVVLHITDGGSLPASDCFTTVTFTDEGGTARELLRADAETPDGYSVVGIAREWVWVLPAAGHVFTPSGVYEITFDPVAGSPAATETVGVSGNTIALEKIHFAEPFMGALYVAAEFENGNIYHYWLQPGTQWEASKVYQLGDLVYPAIPTGYVYKAVRLGSAYPPWAANASRSDGTTSGYVQSMIEPTTYNGFYYTCIATTGSNPRSGTTEPDWPTEDGATVIESTDNPPDVNIPTTTTATDAGTVPSTVTDRYGAFTDRVVKWSA